MSGYFLRLAIAIDQLFNAVLGGRPDHTISGRCGYHAKNGKKWAIVCEKIIDTLFFWQKNHCRESIEWDEVEKPLKKSH